MGRLPYVPDGASAEVDALYGRVTGTSGAIANLYRMLANHPPALDAFLGMSRYVRGGSTLPAGLRELAILTTAYEIGQEYEIAHHVRTAQEIGVSAQKLAAVRPGGDLSALELDERAAVEFSRQVARSLTCDDRTFAAVLERLGKEGAMDLVITAAWYQLCAVILNATGVDLEPDYGGGRAGA